jgi:hypothetical protein
MTIANSVVTNNGTGVFNVTYAPRAATVTVLNTRFTDNLGGIGSYAFGGATQRLRLRTAQSAGTLGLASTAVVPV